MASIRKRGDTFTITAYFGYDEQNRQIKKTTTYHPPDGVTPGKAEKLAKQYAATWEDKIRGYVNLDENRTFADLAQWYYETVAPLTLKGNGTNLKQKIINMYVMPTLGREKLKNITPSMLDSLFYSLLNNGRKRESYKIIDGTIFTRGQCMQFARDSGATTDSIYRASHGENINFENAEKIAAYLKKPLDEVFIPGHKSNELKSSSVQHIKGCLSAIFSAAVKKEIMLRNPCKNTATIKVSKATSSYLDEQQAFTLLSSLEKQSDYQFRTMITLLLFTGMRGGELCALCWSDIDLENGIIHIRHTLTKSISKKGNEPKFILQPPKTKTSLRYVKVPKSIIELLSDYKEWQNENIKMIGVGFFKNDSLFVSSIGEFYNPHYLNTKFKEYAIKLGFPDDIHLHSLRHTTISLLINSGIPVKLIAEQAGHATTKLTQDLYAHVFASSKAKISEALEIKLSPPNVTGE